MAQAFSCLPTPPKMSLSHKIKIAAHNNHVAYFASINTAIEAALLSSLPTSPPAAVTAPLRHVIAAAPATVFPALCVVACELVGGQRRAALPAACAVRLLHAAADAHRRLSHAQPPHSAGARLLAGDAAIPLAFEAAARSECEAAHVLRVLAEIAAAAASGGEGRPLAACAAACGGIVGGGSGDAVERLRQVGLCIGTMVETVGGNNQAELRAMAKSEIEGLVDVEERRREDMLGLLDLWYEQSIVTWQDLDRRSSG